MAVDLANTNNGNVNLSTDNTLYIQNSDTDFILQSGDDAIDVFASGTELVVRGTVGSDTDDGIDILAGETNNAIVIAATGIVFGDEEGIEVSGTSNLITNNGKITGRDDGIDLIGDNNVVNNFGEIIGDDQGIDASGTTNTRIYNHGQITGSGSINQATVQLGGNGNLLVNTGTIIALGIDSAVRMGTIAGGANTLINTGTLSGQDSAGNTVIGGDGEDTVINEGTINGNVSLGGGNDVFNGTGGSVFGSVSGGAGDDLYIVDDPTLTLVEFAGEGIDTVVANTGWKLRDNFENLNLVGDGDHTGVGNNLANVINGNIGDNVLEGLGGDDVIRGGGGNDTLHGGGGDDTLFGSIGDDELFGGPGNDHLRGGAGNDSLYGNDGDDRLAGGSGDDVLLGGGGDDVLIGNRGDDVLVGGMGVDRLFGRPDADRFVYNSALESPVGAGRDRINGFSSTEGDRIDVSGIDADVSTGADDSFTFIGTAPFSGSAGELRYFVNNSGHAIVNGDIDGDGVADFEIAVNDTAVLTAGDFLL